MPSEMPQGQSYSRNMEAIGYIDLQGKPAFKLAIHKKGERWYLYTACLWHPGFHISDITDPRRPRYLRYVPGPANTWTLQVQIAQGRMITSQERIPPGWGDAPGPFGEGFVIWDLADPEDPKPLGHFNTGGAGTHRN